MFLRRRRADTPRRLPLRLEAPIQTSEGWLLRLEFYNAGPVAPFDATVEFDGADGAPPEIVHIAWRGSSPQRTERIEHRGAQLLRLALARPARPSPHFLLLGIDPASGVEGRRLISADWIELKLRVRNCELDRVVVEQVVWLGYALRDGRPAPSLSLSRPFVAETEGTDEWIEPWLSDAEVWSASTSQDRYRTWLAGQDFSPEYLLPCVDREIVREWPAYMTRADAVSDQERTRLEGAVAELAPWFEAFRLAGGIYTRDMSVELTRDQADRLLFRRDLIGGTVEERLGEELATATVLDIGCNSGFFSLDMAARGAHHVDGIDLRARNIAQARFLAEHYGIENVAFQTLDTDAIETGKQYDVVLNLGVLYHVTDPLQFLRQTYDLCRRFAIIDTVCHLEPISGYILFSEKDVDRPSEGREHWELHPTYRGTIEAIRYAGFTQAVEILGHAEVPHPLYAAGARRCFLAVK